LSGGVRTTAHDNHEPKKNPLQTIPHFETPPPASDIPA
jgi:hypothetical protein